MRVPQNWYNDVNQTAKCVDRGQEGAIREKTQIREPSGESGLTPEKEE